MSNEAPILIRMKGSAGEVTMTIPYTYVVYYVADKGENSSKAMAAVNLAITAYKAMEPS